MLPSQRLKIEDDWAAFQLDSVTSHFGNYVEAKLQEFSKETREPLYSLEQLLRPPSSSEEWGEDDEDMGDMLDALAPFLGKSGVAIKDSE